MGFGLSSEWCAELGCVLDKGVMLGSVSHGSSDLTLCGAWVGGATAFQEQDPRLE